MKLAVATYATKSYFHVFREVIQSISAAVTHVSSGHFILVSDGSEESKDATKVLQEELPEGWSVHILTIDGVTEDAKSYNVSAQLKIAAMQGEAFRFARRMIKPDYFWSVESDNTVPQNALRVLRWVLEMPKEDGSPYYDIAAATYFNGLFLGGFGSPTSPINKDFVMKEKKLPKRFMKVLGACQDRLGKGTNEKEKLRIDRLLKRADSCPPDGNLWEVIAKHGWRRRGWMDYAYPGIGKGSVVPTDWCGLGCTLLSKRALALADFIGYDGKGTQDLFLCWKRWHPAELKIAVVPHVLCGHIKRDSSGEIIAHLPFHDEDPNYKGHIRCEHKPFVPIRPDSWKSENEKLQHVAKRDDTTMGAAAKMDVETFPMEG